MSRIRLMMPLLASAVLLVCTGKASADITLDVFPSSAPNTFGSPSWNGYLANAMNSLENNLGNIGDRSTDPTAYEIAGPIVEPTDFMVSSFNSWRGVADPTAPFANEYGNRLHFGLHAYGDGAIQFTLQEIIFELHSSDPADSLEFTGNFIGLDYSATRFGVDWGPDRAKGTLDDIVYTSGNGAKPVDEIVYVGIGNALWPADPSEIGDTVDYILQNAPFSITAAYEIQGFTGSATVTAVPEPTGFALAGMALLGAAGYAVRRRRRAAMNVAQAV